jgi:hypothetical protein
MAACSKQLGDAVTIVTIAPIASDVLGASGTSGRVAPSTCNPDRCDIAPIVTIASEVRPIGAIVTIVTASETQIVEQQPITVTDRQARLVKSLIEFAIGKYSVRGKVGLEEGHEQAGYR